MMPAIPKADQDLLHKLLLGQLPSAEAERLAAEYADDGRLAQLAESLAGKDDTLLDLLRHHETVVDPEAERLVERLLVRLQLGRTSPQPLSLGEWGRGEGGPLGERGRGEGAPPDQTAALNPPLREREGGSASEASSPAAAPEPQTLPERLEYYRPLKVLGQGGMGTVYLALDTRLGREVALKTLRPELAANPQAKERFLREARAAAAVEHEHVVAIFQVGQEGGVPFLAMPLLKGMSLAERLKRGHRLTTPQILRLGRQIALGLAAAHAQGLIHRDIKPANIWLEENAECKMMNDEQKATSPQPSGDNPHSSFIIHPSSFWRVKLLDFGLARVAEEETSLTQTGAIVGTPAYMAPEQARHDKVDARADLFSLGCVLYQMLAGQRPFAGANTMSILMSLAVDTPPAPHTLNPQCPAALSRLVMKLLEKDPAARPASAQEVIQALAAIEDDKVTTRRGDKVTQATATAVMSPNHPVTVSTCHPVTLSRRSRRWPLVAAALLLAFIPLSYFFGGQIIRVVTNQGELVVEVDDPAVEIKIVQNGVVVQDKTSKREFTLTAGKGEIEVLEKDGIKLATRQFELTRGGKTTVKVTLPELADARVDSDRRAAEWVLSIGGNIRITENGKEGNPKAVNALPRGPFELRIVDLTKNGKVNDAGLACMKNCKNLTHLFLQAAPVSDAGLAHFRDCKNLTLLTLNMTQVTATGIAKFKKALPNCKIESDFASPGDPDRRAAEWLLSIGGTISIKENGKERDIKAVGDLPRGAFELTVVGLDHNPKVSDAGLAHFKDCKNLTYLFLAYTKVSDAGLADLAGLPRLTGLSLVNTRISLRGHERLKAALPKCQITWSELNRSVAQSVLALGGTVEIGPRHGTESRPIKAADDLPRDGFQVRRVSLAGVAQPLDKLPEQLSLLRIPEFDRLESIDLSGITGLNYDFLAPIHGLRELSLANTGLNDESLANLPKLPTLKRLVLDGNDIRGNGLTSLKKQPALIDLSLSHPNLTDLFAKNLAELKQVKRLALAGSGLTDAGIKHLAGLPSLEWLDLRRTRASAAGVAALQKALPKCRIDWDGKKDK